MALVPAETEPQGPGLGFRTWIFDEFIPNDTITPMRMLHYRQRARMRREKARPNMEQSPGLEVLDSRTGEWKPVPPNPAVYVVNIGDMLSFWTKNEYKSSVHRVINREPRDRYSIVFFFDGNGDAKLSPLDGSEDNPLTVEQHMIHRVAESYGKK
ncbi:hypothetical protein BDV12DRAFT_202160 [Aspergillus spectabilis]